MVLGPCGGSTPQLFASTNILRGGPKSTSVVDLGVSSILGQVGSLEFDGVLNLYSSIYDFKTHIPLMVILLFF